MIKDRKLFLEKLKKSNLSQQDKNKLNGIVTKNDFSLKNIATLKATYTQNQSLMTYLPQLNSIVAPDNFKQCSPNIAGMSLFSENADLFSSSLWLYREGYKTIISIESEEAKETADVTQNMLKDVKWYESFLADWHAPSVNHLLEYCKLVERRKVLGKVVTHCWGGTGRTGCFLAAYYLYSTPNTNAEDAFEFTRIHYNTGSIEMKIQYNALARFSDYLGRKPSKDANAAGFNHFGGHWHGSGNGGMNHDPGHCGLGKNASNTLNIYNIMVAKNAASLSHPPYFSHNFNQTPRSV